MFFIYSFFLFSILFIFLYFSSYFFIFSIFSFFFIFLTFFFHFLSLFVIGKVCTIVNMDVCSDTEALAK